MGVRKVGCRIITKKKTLSGFLVHSSLTYVAERKCLKFTAAFTLGTQARCLSMVYSLSITMDTLLFLSSTHARIQTRLTLYSGTKLGTKLQLSVRSSSNVDLFMYRT